MAIRELVIRGRSYRRFDQSRAVEERTLIALVDVARLCPSAANRQPLKYWIAATAEENTRIFPYLRWAAALKDWPGPAEGERPVGYILILGDTGLAKRFEVDCGIAAQTIHLAAAEQGLGDCMIASIDQQGLRQSLGLPQHLEVLLVLALGYPSETVVLEDGRRPDERPYWRDALSVHHVPKRPLDEVLVRR